jgi:hypothetical protein
MSRFEEMLAGLLPSMQIRWELKPIMAQGARERFAAWSKRQQALAPTTDAPSFLDQVSGEQDVWRVDEAHFLYRDRYLRVSTTFKGYLPASAKYAYRSIQGVVDNNWFRYGLFAHSSEDLVAKITQPAARVTLLTMHMSHLLRMYQGEPDDGTALFYASKRLYALTAPFFGQGFRPLMEALKLHLSGERERVLHPLNTEGGGCVIAASLVDRLVAEHLGLVRFTCRPGKEAAGQDERYNARLETYARADRDQVVGYLAAQHRAMRTVEVRLLLCELALRKVIPSGVYVVQAE